MLVLLVCERHLLPYRLTSTARDLESFTLRGYELLNRIICDIERLTFLTVEGHKAVLLGIFENHFK